MNGKANRIAIVLSAAAAVAAAAPGRGSALGLSAQGSYGIGELSRDLSSSQNSTYGAILGLHFTGPLGLELEYQHASNDVSGLVGVKTIDQDGVLGHVRLDLLRGPLVPFAYAGVGWVRYSVSGSVASTTSDQAVIPAGVGLELWFRPLVVGIRGEYQWVPNEIAGKNAAFWKGLLTLGLRVP